MFKHSVIEGTELYTKSMDEVRKEKWAREQAVADAKIIGNLKNFSLMIATFGVCTHILFT